MRSTSLPVVLSYELESDFHVTDFPNFEISRSAVARIREISVELLEQTQRLRSMSLPEIAPVSAGVSTESIWMLVDSVVAEKQHQYRGRTDVIIEMLEPEVAYPVFAAVHAQLFRRMLSNLIDNAVEAIEASGQVQVVAAQDRGGLVAIEVRDTGRGIRPEVLPPLMEKGQTHGKPGGSGLGLYAAKQALAAWGGNLRIASEWGHGTTVTATLPLAAPPDWFVPEIRIPAGATVVVVDDDPSIHEVWRRRLAVLAGSGEAIEQVHLTALHELRPLCAQREQTAGAAPQVVLMDFEFHGAESSGLDCITCLGVAASSILVTSRADEAELRARCTALGVSLLPKSAAPFVPLRRG